MKKPRIAVCFLTLAMTVWAAHPVALADGINWLTPGDAAPEPVAEERSAEAETSWFTLGEDDTDSTDSSEPDRGEILHWLDPDETRDFPEEAPEPEDDGGWLRPGEVPVEEEPEPEKEKWLTPDDAADYVEEPEPEPEDAPEWLTPDALTGVEPEPEPEQPEEEEEWLTVEKSPEPEETPEPEEPKAEEAEPEKPSDPELGGGALIEVKVPANGDMVINPHHLPVNLGGTIIRDQLINRPQILTNRSDVPIIVTASVTVNANETKGVTVTDRPIGEGETDKLAYLYVEFQNIADADSEAAWSGGYTGAFNQLLAKGSGTVSGDVLRVEAGDKIPSFAAYRVFGTLTENPETSWKSGDKLSVTVSFTFRPAEEPKQDEKGETAEEPEEAEAEPVKETVEQVEAETEPEEAPEMKEKADAKPEEVPEAAEEPNPEPDPGPEPEAQETAAYEPAAVFELEREPEEEPEPSKPKSEGLDSFAAGANPDWMRPPE